MLGLRTRGRLARARARTQSTEHTIGGCSIRGSSASFCNRTRQTTGSVCPRSSRFRHHLCASNGQPIPYLVSTHTRQSMCARGAHHDGRVSRRVRARSSLPPSRRDALADANGQIGRASGVGRVLQACVTPSARARAPGTTGRGMSAQRPSVYSRRGAKFKVSNRVCATLLPPYLGLAAVRSLAETPHGTTRIGVTGGHSRVCKLDTIYSSPQSPPPTFRFSTRVSFVRSFLHLRRRRRETSRVARTARTSSRWGSVFVVALRLSYTVVSCTYRRASTIARTPLARSWRKQSLVC